MAGRAGRSRNAGKARNSRSTDSNGSVGWGIETEGEPDDIMMRRVVFSVLVAIVGCVGAWFVVEAVRNPGSGYGVTNIAASKPYTVQLMQVKEENRELGLSIAKKSLRRIGVRHSCGAESLGGGQVAICVGGFDTPDDAGAAELLETCRPFRFNSGERPFQDAKVIARP